MRAKLWTEHSRWSVVFWQGEPQRSPPKSMALVLPLLPALHAPLPDRYVHQWNAAPRRAVSNDDAGRNDA